MLLLEGLFVHEDGTLVCPEGPVFPQLQKFVGKQVFFFLHYMLPDAVCLDPGFGSCVSPVTCKTHLRDPRFLLHLQLEGILTSPKKDHFEMQGNNLFEDISGHHCRLFLLEKVSTQASFHENLMQAAQMELWLQALRREIKK